MQRNGVKNQGFHLIASHAFFLSSRKCGLDSGFPLALGFLFEQVVREDLGDERRLLPRQRRRCLADLPDVLGVRGQAERPGPGRRPGSAS